MPPSRRSLIDRLEVNHGVQKAAAAYVFCEEIPLPPQLRGVFLRVRFAAAHGGGLGAFDRVAVD